ncbi:MAG: porin [Verrucomicrobiota bacterium]
MKRNRLLLASLALGVPAILPQGRAQTAGTANSSQAASEPSVYEQIWSYADWYKNKDNPIIQRFSFTGRFQLDYALVHADQGDHEEWNIRRFRMGAKAQLFHNFTWHGEADLNPQEPRPMYERLTDMNLAWSRSDSLTVKVGKQSAEFTMDGQTSSKELLAIDRSNESNNLWFPQEYIPGVTFSGEVDSWVYNAGIFSSGSANKEFGEFDGGVFFLGTLGYDLGKNLGVKQAVLTANYVYNEPDRNNTFTRSLQNIGSINFNLDTGKWGVRTDVTVGTGYLGQSDLWGAMIMPYYNITPQLQAVARYQFIQSEDNNGVRLARYESEVVSGRGDQYSEVYLGLNYYFFKHKLKIQTGVDYAEMRDQAADGGEYQGWGWTTGLRVSW